ncbi:hypothetical protein AVEN_129910-1 [Araneus ventricosus]|uniref:Uncharacterized protein n=1 Tax=Araneus ventricosus TaxID=182803 RepID=A0A4Y2JRG7_ARAVE|nr:hypothetical protein AVEN_129910-1 [Araneus ventricosus]
MDSMARIGVSLKLVCHRAEYAPGLSFGSRLLYVRNRFHRRSGVFVDLEQARSEVDQNSSGGVMRKFRNGGASSGVVLVISLLFKITRSIPKYPSSCFKTEH